MLRAGRADHQQFLLEQHPRFDLRVGLVLVVDAKVRAAAGEPVLDLRAVEALHHADRYRRVALGGGADQRREQDFRHGGRQRDCHLAAGRFGQFAHVGTGLLGLAQQEARAFEQHFARGGERDIAPVAAQQRHLHLGGEPRHLARQRRLGDAQVGGCAGEAAEFGDRDEVAELLQVHIRN